MAHYNGPPLSIAWQQWLPLSHTLPEKEETTPPTKMFTYEAVDDNVILVVDTRNGEKK